MGRIAKPASILLIGALGLLSGDGLRPDGAAGGGPLHRPVELRSPAVAPAAGPRDFEAVRVSTRLVERAAAYDTSFLPADLGAYRSDETPGRAAEPRPRGVPAAIVPIEELVSDGETTVSPSSSSRAAEVLQVIETTDINDNQINTGGGLFIPPDTCGAAGNDQLVSVTNVTLRFHDKDGTLTFDTSLADFFGAFAPRTQTFDPKVIYDQFADRFVLLTTELTDVQFGFPADTATIYFAVSDDGDPNGLWYQSALDVQLTFFNQALGFTARHWIDFPGLAIDDQAVYITGRAVSHFSTGGVTGGYRLFVLDKGLGSGGLYDGGSATGGVYDPFAGGGLPTTMQPAHVFGSPGGTVGTWLIGYSGLTNGADGTQLVQVVRVDDPLGAIQFTPQFVTVDSIENTTQDIPNAAQLGTAVRLETNGRRALHAVWRDGSLWTTSQIVGSGEDAGQVSAYWFRLNAPPTGVATIADHGAISGTDIGSATHTFFPSIAVNERGQALIGFAASGPTIYPSAYAVLREPDDPPGTTGPALLVRAGLAFYVRTLSGSSNRWGDYSSVAVDPVDDCFWVHNQYAKLQGTFLNNEGGRWATAFGRVCAYECGNGTPEAPEACDDGNAIDGDACSNLCEVNECGPLDTDGDTLGDGCDPDDDDDGVFDPDDCAPLDAAAAVAPVEVGTLLLDPGLSWPDQPDAVFDVATGLLSKLRSQEGTSGATCLMDDLESPLLEDPRADPFQGDGYYYLVRAQNPCGDGGYGAGSDAAPRVLPAACP